MKVKIFEINNGDILEKRINEWFESLDMNKISIFKMKQSGCTTSGTGYTTVSIFYEEVEDLSSSIKVG